MSALTNNVGFGEATNKPKLPGQTEEGKKIQYKPGASTLSSMTNTTSVPAARKDTLTSSQDDSSVGMKPKANLKNNVGWGSKD